MENENISLGQEVNIPERLLKREQERISAIEKRQEKKGDKEHDGFSNMFNENYDKIKGMINEIDVDPNSGSVNKEELKEKFADINKQILLLNHVIVDAKIFLTSYDMKIYNNKLQELTEQCNILETKLLPRKKFGFKKVDKVKLGGQGDKTDEAEKKILPKDEVDFVKPRQHEEETYIGFYNRSNETLELPSEDVHKKPVSLSNIDSCVVKVNGNASTIHLNNIKNSQIFLGPVSNSVFIDNCTDSTLYLACHQLRMHTSHKCSVYLHVTSRPIIEHCKNIGFAPAVNIDPVLLQLAGLDEGTNHWNEVDDFNWLSVEEKSPNWYVIEETDRKNM